MCYFPLNGYRRALGATAISLNPQFHDTVADAMTTTASLITILKDELKAAHLTYADLAAKLKISESSVKRMLARADMPLSRIDAICQVLKIDFAELARRVAEAQPLLSQLSLPQEKSLVADRKLLLVAICILSQWTLEQILARYQLTEAEVVRHLAQLDRIGIIELRPLNRYRLKLAKTFRWRPNGPLMEFFRENALLDYFSGGFDREAEALILVHGSIGKSVAPALLERLQRVAQDFSHQHQADQKLAPHHREGYTLLLAMRSWDYEVFEKFRR